MDHWRYAWNPLLIEFEMRLSEADKVLMMVFLFKKCSVVCDTRDFFVFVPIHLSH